MPEILHTRSSLFESYFRKLQLDHGTLGHHILLPRNEMWEFCGTRQAELEIEFADRPPSTPWRKPSHPQPSLKSWNQRGKVMWCLRDKT